MKALSRWIGLSVLSCFLVGCTATSSTPNPSRTLVTTSTIEISVAGSLQLGVWHDMVYDEQVGQVILINGGPEKGKSPEDPVELWGWDGKDWSMVDTGPEAPRWRNFASVAYDSNRNVLVLYSGIQPEEIFSETWEWDGTFWKQITDEGPGPREAAGMAYDVKRERIVLFGGTQLGKMMNDTWEWDGMEWKRIPVEGPSARFPAGFAYDETNQNILLFGGHKYEDQGFTTHDDTWTWNGVVWKLITSEGPSARDGARAIFDPLSNNIRLFGGAEITTGIKNLNDTWIWDGTQWEQVKADGPPARVHPAMAFDESRRVVVMTGGSNGPDVILSDTWEWNGIKWACADDC